jgi:hypothetical protein
MAHRDADLATVQPSEYTLNLADLEPVLGLIAAVSRFNASLTEAVYALLSEEQIETLGSIQALLWRMEHSRPDGPGV